ncbi:DUF433 domain-containing protein [soil metagenome]
MVSSATLLKPSEAAVVAGVSLREVNRVIDEGILPDDFLDTGDGRRIAPAACFLIAFYVDSAERLTPKERRFVVDEASARLRKGNGRLFAPPTSEDWIVTDEFLAVNLISFVRSVEERWKKLSSAEELVTISPDVLGGIPVIKGTRVPVHDVAASVEKGIPNVRILSAYPGLTAEQVDLAAFYAQANPPRGRPRLPTPLPAGARILTRRVVRRRQAG